MRGDLIMLTIITIMALIWVSYTIGYADGSSGRRPKPPALPALLTELG